MKGNEQIELQAQRYLYERAHLSESCVVTTFDPFHLEQTFIDGAEWQYEQFEKERLNFEPRLKHCDELTAEQAQMESDFVVQHLKNFNRTPTCIDAIEYGRKAVFDKAIEWLKYYITYDDFGGNMEWLVPFEDDDEMVENFKKFMED